MGTVVLPAIIVAAVGLIAGIILTIAAKLMFVPVDERVAAIEEVLPGANCGACGFAGCSDYAKALGNDADVSTSLCPVGGAAVASQIAEIMGVAGGDVDPKIAMVMCKGTLEATRQIEELVVSTPVNLPRCSMAVTGHALMDAWVWEIVQMPASLTRSAW